MEYIERSDYEGKRHALAETPREIDGNRVGIAMCGTKVTGKTGACIAPMINCERCRASMRRDGYDI